MKSSKLIPALSLTIALVLLTVLVAIGSANTADKTPEAEAAAAVSYSLPRQANASLSPFIELEQTLGGEGDDIPVEAICAGEKIYVFATSSSSEFDLNESNGRNSFCVVLNESLSVESIFFVGDDAEQVVAASMAESGFFVVLEKNGSLFCETVGKDGTRLARTCLTKSNGVFHNLLFSPSGCFVIFSRQIPPLTSNELILSQVSESGGVIRTSTVVLENLKSEYLFAAMLGDYPLVFFNAENDVSKALYAAKCDQSAAQITPLHDKAAKCVTPSDGGFTAIIDGEKSCYAIKIGFDLLPTDTLRFTFPSCEKCTSFYAIGSLYFAFENEECSLFAADFSVSVISEIYRENGRSLGGSLSGSGYGIYSIIGNEGVSVKTCGDVKRWDISARNATNVKIIRSSASFYAVMASEHSSDMKNPLGNTDVFIVKLKI